MTWVSKRGIFPPFWLDLKNQLWHPTFLFDCSNLGNYLYGFVSINYLMKKWSKEQPYSPAKNGL